MKKIYYTANGTYPGHRLTIAEKSAHLYHYTSFESFVKIWLSQKLKFSKISLMNDIQEKSIKCATNDICNAASMIAYQQIRQNYKQISLTMDYDSFFKGCMSPMMWGHYANKGNGVCIEFNLSKLPLPPTTLYGPIHYKKILSHYTYLPSPIGNGQDIDKYIRKNSIKLLFTKQKEWMAENEFRIVSKDLDYLNISNSVESIYLTSYNSTECLLVEKLINGVVPVKFIHYNATTDNLSLPVLTDTKSYREQCECARSNPNNILNQIAEQALKDSKTYFECKYRNLDVQ